MTEFETMKKALERVYGKNVIAKEIDSSFDNKYIDVELNNLTITYWFKNEELVEIDSKIYD